MGHLAAGWKRVTPDAGKPVEVVAVVGTPGVGPATWATLEHKGLPKGVGPVAEFRLAPADPGGEAKTVRVHLTGRKTGGQFAGELTTPEGVKVGLDAAVVRLSFPGCPWGEVEPAEFTLDVIPRRP
ncbi:MAG: hypothetical protein K2X87_23545 [Gemmataceae bacterium]|nr:hypothetical protein [Gemmataceae bacterium]